MALVDYASDDDDDDALSSLRFSSPVTLPTPSTTPIAAPPVPPPPFLLPSAADLLATSAPPASTSTSSSLPRKRPQLNGSDHPSHQPKVPRSNSSSSVRTPLGSTLLPPQIRGRSNVATEDLDKLFVNRQQRRSE